MDGSTLTLTFTQKLNTATAPAASRFTVAGLTPARTVSSVAFRSADSTKVDLTLSSAVGIGDSGITVSYAKGNDANPLKNPGGTDVADFSGQTVENVTLPAVTAASVNGTALTLTFDTELSSAAAPAASRFTVSGTTEATTVTAVAIPSGDATKVNLTLSPRVGATETGITVAYAKGSDANPLKADGTTKEVADFTGRAVTNNSPPVVTDAEVNRTLLTVTFDARLSPSGVQEVDPPAGSRFTVSGTASPTTVERAVFSRDDPGFATQVVLTLSQRVDYGETGITVSYAAGDDSNPLRKEGTGPRVADFTGQTVANNTPRPKVQFRADRFGSGGRCGQQRHGGDVWPRRDHPPPDGVHREGERWRPAAARRGSGST